MSVGTVYFSYRRIESIVSRYEWYDVLFVLLWNEPISDVKP